MVPKNVLALGLISRTYIILLYYFMCNNIVEFKVIVLPPTPRVEIMSVYDQPWIHALCVHTMGFSDAIKWGKIMRPNRSNEPEVHSY